MQIQQVDIVAAQASQAVFYRTNHATSAVASRVGVITAHRQGVFCGNDQALPFPLGETADKGLGSATRIVIRRINEVATVIDVAIKERAGGRLVGAEVPFRTESHGA